MSKKISIILLEDITNLGQAGDIVEATEGYARNFLFPQAKAALATDQAKQEVKDKKQQAAKINDEQLAALQSKADNLAGTELLLTARVKDGTEIYGKITPGQIAKELNKAAKLDLKAKAINLPQPITATGTYDVTVSLSPDVETTIKVTVEPDPDSLPNEDAKE